MSETQEAPSASRLVALGHERPLSRRKPLVELDAKARLLVEYQVNGCPHPFVSQYTRAAPSEFDPDARRPLEPGEPLRLEEAADLLRIRRRHARFIMASPIAQKELALQLQALRTGMKSQALATVGEIMQDRGENSAADRKVRLQAAQTVLGEDLRTPGVSVTVNNQTNVTNLRAGIVIRAKHNTQPSPLETGRPGATIIEHHPLRHEERSLPAPLEKERAE